MFYLHNIFGKRIYKHNLSLINMSMLFLVLFVYFLPTLFIYHPYRIDDAWFTSFIYNDYIKGVKTDETFGGDLQNGLGGTLVFGGVYANTYGFLSAIVGNWGKAFLYSQTIIWLVLTAGVWYLIARSFLISPRCAAALSLTMLISQNFFLHAHSVRPEIFILLFVSLSLLATLYYRYALAICFAFVAIETHPIGSIVLFYIVPVMLQGNQRRYIWANLKQLILQASFAIIACGLVYYAMHGNVLAKLRGLQSAYIPFGSENFFIEYYFAKRFNHNLPELIVVLASVFLYIKHKLYVNGNKVIGILLPSMLVFSVLINRSLGGTYAILAIPAFYLLMFYVFTRLNKLPLLILLILLINIPKYVYMYSRNGHFPSYGVAYQNSLASQIPDFKIPVIGLPNDYWAFLKKGQFYSLCYMDSEKFNANIKTAWLIQHDNDMLMNFYKEFPCENKENIARNFFKEKVSEFKVNGEAIQLYKITNRHFAYNQP